MYYATVEGSGWVFRARDGQTHELFGEEVAEVRREGRKAAVRMQLLSDLVFICLVGRIRKLIEIIRVIPQSISG